MKKYMIALSFFCSLYITGSYAQEVTNTAVLNSFKSSFDVAQDVNWSQVKDLDRADFTMDDQQVVAFFGSEGDIVATSRDVTLLQIPLSLKTGLKKNFGDYTLVSIFELNDENGTAYYATIKNEKREYTLKSNTSGEWMIYKKESN